MKLKKIEEFEKKSDYYQYLKDLNKKYTEAKNRADEDYNNFNEAIGLHTKANKDYIIEIPHIYDYFLEDGYEICSFDHDYGIGLSFAKKMDYKNYLRISNELTNTRISHDKIGWCAIFPSGNIRFFIDSQDPEKLSDFIKDSFDSKELIIRYYSNIIEHKTKEFKWNKYIIKYRDERENPFFQVYMEEKHPDYKYIGSFNDLNDFFESINSE